MLLDCSVVFVVVVLLLVCSVVFVGGFCASACFFAARAKRLRSASLLPEATRPDRLAVAGFVCGTLEVTRSGVAGATVSSGIASNGFASIVYI